MTKRRYRRSQQDPLAAAISLALLALIWAFYSSSFWKSPYFVPLLCIGLLVLLGIGIVLSVYLNFRKHAQQLEHEKAWTAMQTQLKAQAAARIARHQERDRRLNTAWLRAMSEMYPEHDINSFPRGPSGLDAVRLELLAVQIYSKLGYRADHNGGAGDQGIDVFLRQDSKVAAVVQCKQYQVPVKPNHVRELNGARKRWKGILWSPSGFSDEARKWARENYPDGLELVDSNAILALTEKAYPPPAPSPEPMIVATSPVSPAINFPKEIPIVSPHPKPVNHDPLTSLVKELARRSGLTFNQVQVLFAILLLGIMGITVLGVLAIITTLR